MVAFVCSVAQTSIMATHFIPSSDRCDCGYECHFFERTIREMGKVSQHKTQYLVEDGHRIEFTVGKAVAVHCPTLGRCPITGTEI
jgi:hypothetical protein